MKPRVWINTHIRGLIAVPEELISQINTEYYGDGFSIFAMTKGEQQFYLGLSDNCDKTYKLFYIGRDSNLRGDIEDVIGDLDFTLMDCNLSLIHYLLEIDCLP